MNRLIHEDSSGHFDQVIQAQYMASVSAVGQECGIRNTQLAPYSRDDFYGVFQTFSLVVQGEVARILVRQRGTRHPYSVLLADNTRPKLDHHIDRLREAIHGAEFPESHKRVLLSKLD